MLSTVATTLPIGFWKKQKSIIQCSLTNVALTSGLLGALAVYHRDIECTAKYVAKKAVVWPDVIRLAISPVFGLI